MTPMDTSGVSCLIDVNVGLPYAARPSHPVITFPPTIKGPTSSNTNTSTSAARARVSCVCATWPDAANSPSAKRTTNEKARPQAAVRDPDRRQAEPDDRSSSAALATPRSGAWFLEKIRIAQEA
ncbi:hypothetical protein B0A49_11584 [Cryomyces minteri]|uniref:Uncharacterized protein n=1 Tax=Cryomyces minteri TaxID=331657 RepID=A0A4U0WIU5_9PEZI|nr:hypothetical protein B0A49_11584 [Cryomyces minteri]